MFHKGLFCRAQTQLPSEPERHRNGAIARDYERAEAAARSGKKGLWAGEFEGPYEFRRQNGSYNPFESTNK